MEKPVDKTADGTTVARPRSVRSALSTRSRKSKWGNDDAEPLGDVHKRQWLEVGYNPLTLLTISFTRIME